MAMRVPNCTTKSNMQNIYSEMYSQHYYFIIMFTYIFIYYVIHNLLLFVCMFIFLYGRHHVVQLKNKLLTTTTYIDEWYTVCYV